MLGSLIGIATLVAIRAEIRKLSKMKPLRGDQIPEIVVLNKDRKLLREGKTKEAIAVVRTAVEMGEIAPTTEECRHIFDMFGLGVIGAFHTDSAAAAETRDHIDDEVIGFVAEMAGPEIASWLRESRDDYFKKYPLAMSSQ